MKGDFSRFTFNPKKRFSRVLMQQGRVQLDADWNEQLDITEHRIAAEITDFIGQSGAPEKYAGFAITPTDDKKNLNIGAGRYYVEGTLFEDGESVVFTNQPDFPSAELPKEDGIYLAYLDVWQRHITALEDPDIREVALGGADTTTRVKNVWQVKLRWQAKLEDEGKVDKSEYAPPDWKPTWEKPISTGRLSAIMGGSGTNLENQLYRVEIHSSGTLSEATFKWSRDNGSVATRVENIEGKQIPVSRLGQDIQTVFAAGNWVEIITEKQILFGEPGLLVELVSVTANALTVKEWPGGKAPDYDPSMIVRRWDSGAIKVQNYWIPLESEIKIRFESQTKDDNLAEAEYKTGDYWLIPARNLKANIEWTPNESQPPHGILHRYSSLALVELKGGRFTLKNDCRVLFKPLTTGLLSKGGDTMTGPLTINADLYVTGNVGIGTMSSIDGKLDVRGDVYVGTGQSNDNNKLVIRGSAGSFPDLSYKFTGAGSAKIRASRGDSWDTYLQFLTNENVFPPSDSPKVRLHINGDGRVGIGTTDPKSQLAVSGGVAIGSSYADKIAAPNNGLLVEGNIAIGGKIGEGIITKIYKDDSKFNINLELASGSELYLLPAIVPKGHDSLTISITRNGKGWGNSSDWTIGCLFGAVVNYISSGQQNGLNTYQVDSMKEQDNKWILEINLPSQMIDNSYGIFIIVGRYKHEQ